MMNGDIVNSFLGSVRLCQAFYENIHFLFVRFVKLLELSPYRVAITESQKYKIHYRIISFNPLYNL